MRDAVVYADQAGLRASDGDGTGQPGHGRGLRGVEENHYHAPQIRRSRSGLAASPRDFTRSRRREMMAASDWRCAPATPHSIKGGRDDPAYRAIRRYRNIQQPKALEWLAMVHLSLPSDKSSH